LAAGRTVFNYSGVTVTDISSGNEPSLLNTWYTITAEIGVPKARHARGTIENGISPRRSASRCRYRCSAAPRR
jgi:hypothetical protein